VNSLPIFFFFDRNKTVNYYLNKIPDTNEMQYKFQLNAVNKSFNALTHQ